MKAYSEPEALNKAAAYCTLCERCTSEVSAKLTAWGMTGAQQRRIIERLIDEKFIDERRYCSAFVNDKVRFNHWGRIKIVAKLREKKLPADIVSEALDAIDEEEYNTTLRKLLNNKLKELKNSDDECQSKQKLLRFAISRGFEYPLILKHLKFDPDEMDF